MSTREGALLREAYQNQLAALREVLAISREQSEILAQGDAEGFCDSVRRRQSALGEAMRAHEALERAGLSEGFNAEEKKAISDLIEEILAIDAQNAAVAKALLEAIGRQAGMLRAARKRAGTGYGQGAAFGGIYFDKRK